MSALYRAALGRIIVAMILSEWLGGLQEVGRLKMRRIVVYGVLVSHALAGPLFAQRPAQQMPEEDGGFIQWGIALGIALIACLPAFLNPKRSHLS